MEGFNKGDYVKDTCEHCKFFKINRCRRHPPQRAGDKWTNSYGHEVVGASTDWPSVSEDDWCGDWVEKLK